MNQPLINGVAYSWSQIRMNILGVEVAGVTEINYSDDQEMQNNYGGGNQPVSRGYGQITYEASISMHMEEVEAITAVAPNRRLQDIPEFDIPVLFVPENGGVIVTHVLKNWRFKNNRRANSRGDMENVVELQGLISHIIW